MDKENARAILSQSPTLKDDGQSFIDAYKAIFDEDLISRLNCMIHEYGECPPWLCWELQAYGWDTPFGLLSQFPNPL